MSSALVSAQTFIAEAPNKEPMTKSEFLEAASEKFQKLDVDFSGFIEKDEIENANRDKEKAIDQKNFDLVDANFDGNLTFEEYENHFGKFDEQFDQRKEKQANDWFDKADTDNNDFLSRDEYVTLKRAGDEKFKAMNQDRRKHEFKSRDIDKDGVVSRLEYVDRKDSMGQKPKSKPTSPFTSRFDREGKKLEIPDHDTDKDGRISRTEDENFRKAQFKFLDKNGNGIVTPKENSGFNHFWTEDAFLGASSGQFTSIVVSVE